MKLSEKLFLTIPVFEDDGESIKAYVHSAPVSREIFDAHFLLISKTFAAVYAESLGHIAGPRVAASMMRHVAKNTGALTDYTALIGEIYRLTNVVMKVNGTWRAVPFHEVIGRQMFDEDEVSEVENAIVFFIAGSAMWQRQTRRAFLTGAAEIWGAQISSLNCMEFAGSLQTSSATASSGVSQTPVSSVPH